MTLTGSRLAFSSSCFAHPGFDYSVLDRDTIDIPNRCLEQPTQDKSPPSVVFAWKSHRDSGNAGPGWITRRLSSSSAPLPVNAQVSETLHAKQGTKTDEHLEVVSALGDDTMTGELMLVAVAQAVNLSF